MRRLLEREPRATVLVGHLLQILNLLLSIFWCSDFAFHFKCPQATEGNVCRLNAEQELLQFLILLTFLFTLAFHGLGTNLLVVFFKGSKILTTLRELSLLHPLSDIPVNEGTLGVHEIELVVHAGKHLSNCGGVGDHAASTLHLGQVTTWHDSGSH